MFNCRYCMTLSISINYDASCNKVALLHKVAIEKSINILTHCASHNIMYKVCHLNRAA